jgi:hypothetical protein
VGKRRARRDPADVEVADLLEQIAALVRGRAFLRRAGIDARELRALDDEIGRLQYRLADASRRSARGDPIEVDGWLRSGVEVPLGLRRVGRI